ncbi:MAG: hypothetical protein EPN58_11520 [Rhodanobacter sp.]|nr:MAG: hypothetical protein EPN58_11520 [Rhodanobacter sp.]
MAKNENTKNWLRRLLAKNEPIDNVQAADASNHIHNLIPGACLIQDGMGQLPYDVDLLIDIKLRPDLNWAPLHGMDGAQIRAALKSFRPTSKAVRS